MSDSTFVEISEPGKLPPSPLVSVYMLAYRHEKYITQAIEGVISQQCDFPIELIIGEDCSPDGTREIVLDYQRRHPELIRVITASANVGAHANAARCRDACRGTFIAICEGDDYWHHPGKLQMQVDLMSASPGVTLCHTEFDRRIGFRIKPDRHRALGHQLGAEGTTYPGLLREWTVITGTAMYRRLVVDEFRASRFYNRAWPFGDYNLALFASNQGHVRYLDTSTATWRRVSGSASNAGADKSLAMHLAANECRHLFMQAFPVGPADALSIEEAMHRKSLRLAFWAGRSDIYCASLAWLREHGLLRGLARNRLELFCLRARYPVKVSARLRGWLRGLAEFDPYPGRTPSRQIPSS